MKIQLRILNAFLTLLLFSYQVCSQSEFKCATDEVLNGNPALQKLLTNYEKRYNDKKKQGNLLPDMTTIYTIPVVFHVYHLGEPVGTGSNVSDAAIQASLDRLNATFRATGIHSNLTPDIKIQFVLASRTQDCQNTNGIVRVDGRSIAGYTNGVPFYDYSMQEELRKLSNWYRGYYINIRICHKIIGTGGFAYFLNDLFMPASSVNTSSNQPGLDNFWAHEMGHSLNLYHTFNGDGTGNGTTICPVNNDPENDGDKISDTDPHKSDDGCDYNAINSCTGQRFGDVLKNIMSYSCTEKFTPKQMERMRYALINYTSLTNSLGKVPPESTTYPTNACFVTATNGTGNYFGISEFRVGNISYTGSSSASTGSNYLNLICQGQTEMQVGSSYTFNLAGTYGNSSYGKIFIDYNNDGDFDDSNETVFDSNRFLPSHTGSITPPSNTLTNTLLRMRVMLDAANMTSCNLPGRSGGDGSGMALDFSVKILPSPCSTPTTNNTSRCGTGTVTLSASGCAGTYNWYATSSGGSSLASTASFTTPSINATTNYYVDCTVSTCVSGRGSATATVNTTSPPVVAATTINSGQTATLTATGCEGIVNWYNTPSGGPVISTEASFTTPTLSSSITYYADCTINGCVSNIRTSGTVNINITSMHSLKTGIWNDLTLWSYGRVPASTDIVTIKTGHLITIPTTYTANAKSIIFEAGGKIIEASNTSNLCLNCPSTIPTNGLVLYLPLDGNANDASGNNNHGVVTGATLGNDRFGVANKAYRFNDGNRITVTNSTSLSLTNAFAVSMWVNMQSTTGRDGWGSLNTYGYHSLFTKNCDRGQLQAAIAPSTDGTFQFLAGVGSSGNNPVIPFSLNQWKHLGIVYDGSNLKHFVNGTEVSSVATTMNLSLTNSNDLFIGYMGCFNYFFNGFIDEFRMYNRGLSNSEVNTIYTAEKP